MNKENVTNNIKEALNHLSKLGAAGEHGDMLLRKTKFCLNQALKELEEEI